MTAPGRGTMRCDQAGCTRAATVDQDAWAFCAEHAGRPTTRPAPAVRAVPSSPPAPSKPVVDLDTVTAQEQQHGVTLATPSPLGLLLEQASGHSVAKVRRLAERIESQLGDLRGLIAEHAADEQRRKAEDEARRQALAEVQRLEAALAAAKAKLPRRSTGPGNRAPRTPAQIEAAKATLAKARAAKAAKQAQQ